MSNYTKVIIFIAFLIVFSAAVIYLYNSENSINEVMPDVSDSILAGDSDYNQAVDLLNAKNYDEAKNKAISARNNFNQSMIELLNIKENFTSDTDDIHKSYINTVLNELELKINATDYLLESIDYYRDYENATGNEYSYQANILMDDALEFQNARIELVSDNPNSFK